MASKWYRRGRGIGVGDVVTFDSVIEPGERVIKRVIGMEGDYVLMDTPGSGSDAMIQVSACRVGDLRVDAYRTRYLRVIVGLWVTTCTTRWTRGYGDRCRWD